MPLIRNGAVIADDWTLLATDDGALLAEDLPAGGIIVPHGRLATARQSRHNGPLGVLIDNDLDIDALLALVGAVDMIVVPFPAFGDGRGFSIARTLRNGGFIGVLRARGPLIADQAAFAEACGFDELDIPDDHAGRQKPAQYAAAREAFSARYQDGYAAAAQPVSILAARHAARH
ncbi:MAG: DUF934 domain-containing protein [Rhodobiaceae bacterium]|nr:DUF934 domain-containing protein [Rhodobiaceae bacterium]